MTLAALIIKNVREEFGFEEKSVEFWVLKG